MSATCFEPEGLSSGRRLYIQVWCSVLNIHEVENCVPYTLFYLQECLRTFMIIINRNNRSVCVWHSNLSQCTTKGSTSDTTSGSHVSACRNCSSYSSTFSHILILFCLLLFLIVPLYEYLPLPPSFPLYCQLSFEVTFHHV
jgi:hypothetical protein